MCENLLRYEFQQAATAHSKARPFLQILDQSVVASNKKVDFGLLSASDMQRIHTGDAHFLMFQGSIDNLLIKGNIFRRKFQ